MYSIRRKPRSILRSSMGLWALCAH